MNVASQYRTSRIVSIQKSGFCTSSSVTFFVPSKIWWSNVYDPHDRRKRWNTNRHEWARSFTNPDKFVLNGFVKIREDSCRFVFRLFFPGRDHGPIVGAERRRGQVRGV